MLTYYPNTLFPCVREGVKQKYVNMRQHFSVFPGQGIGSKSVDVSTQIPLRTLFTEPPTLEAFTG